MAKLTTKAGAQLREHLAAQAPDRLVDLVMAEVERNPDLRDRLLLEVAQAGGSLDLAQFRRSFSDALRSTSTARSRSSYPRTSGPWARAVHESIARIGALLPAGHAAAVVELTEYALGRVDMAMGTLDDSSGWFSDIVTDLERLHHQACLVVRPDPVALAQRLFAFEVDGEWDIFIDSVERYADVLGDDGVAEMRRLAEARWAQRGLVAFADDPRGRDLRLDDFVLGTYLESERADDLVALVWRRFDQRPSAGAYARMRLWSDQVGRWDGLRPMALDRLRADAERAAAAKRTARAAAERRWGAAPPVPSAYQTLIEVLLHDGAAEEAWQLATEHGCSQPLWMDLAKVREADHPADAVSVYRNEVEDLIARKRTHTYRAAVDLVGHIVEVLRGAGLHDAARDFVAEIRRRHKPKTKFLGFLADAGL